MIKLSQCIHNLLGAEEDINALCKKPFARILAVSDSHGSRDTLLAVIKAMGNQCDAVVFCGDGVQDLLYCISCAIASKGAIQMPDAAAFVRGNNDFDRYHITAGAAGKNTYTSDGFMEIAVPNRQVLMAAGHTIFVTHGHREGAHYSYSSAITEEARMAGADIVLFGHTHVAEDAIGYRSIKDEGQRQIIEAINPGSLKFPRGGRGPSFAVVEVQNGGGMSATFYGITATLAGLSIKPFSC